MLDKIDKIKELLNVPTIDASTETAITNMKILNLLVDLRAGSEKLSGVRRSYSFENMENAYEEGIYEGTLRQMHKDKNSDKFIHSDLKHYMKAWE